GHEPPPRGVAFGFVGRPFVPLPLVPFVPLLTGVVLGPLPVPSVPVAGRDGAGSLVATGADFFPPPRNAPNPKCSPATIRPAPAATPSAVPHTGRVAVSASAATVPPAAASPIAAP